MKRIKIVSYAIILIYLLVSVYFVFFSEDLFDRFGMLEFLDFLEVWAILGLVFLVVAISIDNVQISQLTKKNIQLEKEVARLKGKFFDREEENEAKESSLKSFGDSLPAKKKAPESDEFQ